MEEVLDIGVCDDDREVCLSLAKRIRAIDERVSVRLFESAEELLRTERKPEVLFLDVLLGGMDGLEAARELRGLSEDTEIVFISGNPDYVFDAFEVDAANYLVKPFSEEKLRGALEHARGRIRKRREREPELFVSKRGARIRVRHRDLMYAEVFNRTVVLHTTRGEISYYGKMAELEKSTGEDFFRCHRAYLVNYRHVDSFERDSCRVGDERIPIAKSVRAEFARGYMRFIRRQDGEP